MDSPSPHWAHCVTTLIRYPLILKPFGAPDAIQTDNSFQIVHIVSTQVFLSHLAKSRFCTQHVGYSLLLLLISAASAEIVSKVYKTNAPRMLNHNAMLHADTDNYTERTSLEFKQTHYVPFIQPWSDFTLVSFLLDSPEMFMRTFQKLVCIMKSPWSSRQCVGLLDKKPGFDSQARHQNEIRKVFLRRFPLSRFLAKTLSVK